MNNTQVVTFNFKDCFSIFQVHKNSTTLFSFLFSKWTFEILHGSRMAFLEGSGDLFKGQFSQAFSRLVPVLLKKDQSVVNYHQ